jgi:hypothetical protein
MSTREFIYLFSRIKDLRVVFTEWSRVTREIRVVVSVGLEIRVVVSVDPTMRSLGAKRH